MREQEGDDSVVGVQLGERVKQRRGGEVIRRFFRRRKLLWRRVRLPLGSIFNWRSSSRIPPCFGFFVSHNPRGGLAAFDDLLNHFWSCIALDCFLIGFFQHFHCFRLPFVAEIGSSQQISRLRLGHL